MKKFSAVLILALALIAGCLTGCGHIADEEEILIAAEELFGRAEILNQVYWGSGIEADGEKEGTSSYLPADDAWMEGKPFSSVKTLKELTKTVFSAQMCDLIEDTVLTSRKEGESLTYNRYYDQTVNGETVIMVYSAYDPMIEGDNEYDLSSLEVVSIGPNRATVRIDVLVTVAQENGESFTQQHPDEEMKLVYENGKWLIDDYTCISYYPTQE